MLSIHAARVCPCGAGLDTEVGAASGESRGTARLVANLEPVWAVASELLEYQDPPATVLVPFVRCHACGSVAQATHTICRVAGHGVGEAETLAAHRAGGPLDAVGRAPGPAQN